MSITTIPAPVVDVSAQGTTTTQDLSRQETQIEILSELRKMNIHLEILSDEEITDTEEQL